MTLFTRTANSEESAGQIDLKQRKCLTEQRVPTNRTCFTALISPGLWVVSFVLGLTSHQCFFYKEFLFVAKVA